MAFIINNVLCIYGEEDEQTLLEEYQACQAYVDSAATRDWQVAGIIWAAAFAGLFLLVTAGHTLSNAIAATLLCAIVYFLLYFFQKMINRMVYFQEVCTVRMREIERKLGMKKELYRHICNQWENKEELNEWKELSEEEKTHLEHNYIDRLGGGKGAARPRTREATLYINRLIQIAWGYLSFGNGWHTPGY